VKYNMKRLPVNKSDFKKEIKAFIKGGGKIQKLPDEIEWEMFPYWDDCAIERNKNEKGILDYEESRKSIGGEVFKDE
tara:strand:+ start:927 stop:1157 length:231 start_codon:yes stop_codon:yes gene_type:complete